MPFVSLKWVSVSSFKLYIENAFEYFFPRMFFFYQNGQYVQPRYKHAIVIALNKSSRANTPRIV